MTFGFVNERHFKLNLNPVGDLGIDQQGPIGYTIVGEVKEIRFM